MDRHASSMPATSKRGAFQPRDDLQNRSPEDEDVSVVKPSHSNPPLPRSNNGDNTTKRKKKASYLPVKSSGYGRASLPTSTISSSRPKLRHGDGSLAGELALDNSKTRMSTSRSSLLLSVNATAAKSNNRGESGRSRSLSASPAVRSVRSRSPNPAMIQLHTEQQQPIQHHCELNNCKHKRHHFDDDSDEVTSSSNYDHMAMKKQKRQEETTFGSKSSSKAFASPESYNNDKKHHAADFTNHNIDIDPTPVKAAKKLLSDARKRAAVEPTPLSPLIQSPVMEEMNDYVAAKEDNGASLLAQQHSSFDDTSTTAVGSVENIASVFTDLHPNISQTQSLSDNLFSIPSGIASTSIISLIKNKKKSAPVDRSTPSELRKRLERREEELKTLKLVCNDLLQGKDEFVAGAVGIELTLRQKIMGIQTAFGLLGEEKKTLLKQLNDANDAVLKMQEEMECLRRERDLAIAKCNTIQEDCDGVKTNLESLQQSYTNSCVKLALLETKVEESKSQLEQSRIKIIEAQSSTEKAVAEAKVGISKERIVLQEAMKSREMEVCRIMNVDMESVDFDDGSSFLNAVRSKVQEYHHNANTNIDVQNELERLKVELEQSKTDLGVSYFCRKLVLCHCLM